ncbi:hypothetical protein LMG29542_08205 [Paraburkholderia humisilvae]|uniref:Uncharacterized protein n=1 Tax=Paraburkholderia humisilvae TaxID=627669 RepID=A0A6J5F8X5_9BURK|nr:hypothetical protein LMG29542_08205 [Paraburkholderia humisilvae]
MERNGVQANSHVFDLNDVGNMRYENILNVSVFTII